MFYRIKILKNLFYSKLLFFLAVSILFEDTILFVCQNIAEFIRYTRLLKIIRPYCVPRNSYIYSTVYCNWQDNFFQVFFPRVSFRWMNYSSYRSKLMGIHIATVSRDTNGELNIVRFFHVVRLRVSVVKNTQISDCVRVGRQSHDTIPVTCVPTEKIWIFFTQNI